MLFARERGGRRCGSRAAIPFNGLELVWDPRQLLWLSALYLLLALPFFFAASCFGLAFARHGARIPALYGADLLGAGLGALAAVALLALPVDRGLLLAASGGPLAAALVAPRWPHARRLRAGRRGRARACCRRGRWRPPSTSSRG